jgi:hypothetical protein
MSLQPCWPGRRGAAGWSRSCFYANERYSSPTGLAAGVRLGCFLSKWAAIPRWPGCRVGTLVPLLPFLLVAASVVSLLGGLSPDGLIL